MLCFDEIRVAPGRDDLHELIRAARLQTGLQASAPQTFDATLDRVADEAEGEHVWPSQYEPDRPLSVNHLVRLAWWSDYLGRRHARLRGFRREGPYAHAWPVPWEVLPPLLEIYPTTGLLVEGATLHYFVVCPCGAFGSPQQIAWMGTECGPCHDRRTAGELPPRPWDLASARPAFRAESGLQLHRFASPILLAVRAASTRLLFNLRTGDRSPVSQQAGEPLAWSPTGDVVVYAPNHREFLLYSATDGSVERRLPGYPASQSRAARFSPSGRYLAIQEYQAWEAHRLRVWDRHQPTAPPIDYGGSSFTWCFSRDERFLIVSENLDGLYTYRLDQPGATPQLAPRSFADVVDNDPVPVIDHMDLLPGGDLVAISSDPVLLRVLAVPSAKVLHSLRLLDGSGTNEMMWVDPTGRAALVPIPNTPTLLLISLPHLTCIRRLRIPEGIRTTQLLANDDWLVLSDGTSLRILPGPPLVEWFHREVNR